MKSLRLGLIAFSLISFVLSSCSRRTLDFTLISSKSIDLTKSNSFVRGKSKVKDKDFVHVIVFVPNRAVSIKQAIDNAIESTPGCVALIDGVILTKFWWIPYLYGQQIITVEGIPLIDPSLVTNTTEGPTYSKIELDKNGDVKKVESLSSSEYFALKGEIANNQEQKFKNSEDLK